MGDRGDLNSHSATRSNSLNAGGANKNRRGQVLGGQPGTPIKPPFLRTQIGSIRTSYLPTAPKSVRYKNRVICVLLRIGRGLLAIN